jgi:hypothetical protein
MNSNETFKILCSVSGGVTGNRTAYLKSHGVEKVFTDHARAVKEATYLNDEMNRGPRNGARFQYTVVPVEEL